MCTTNEFTTIYLADFLFLTTVTFESELQVDKHLSDIELTPLIFLSVNHESLSLSEESGHSTYRDANFGIISGLIFSPLINSKVCFSL